MEIFSNSSFFFFLMNNFTKFLSILVHLRVSLFSIVVKPVVSWLEDNFTLKLKSCLILITFFFWQKYTGNYIFNWFIDHWRTLPRIEAARFIFRIKNENFLKNWKIKGYFKLPDFNQNLVVPTPSSWYLD